MQSSTDSNRRNWRRNTRLELASDASTGSAPHEGVLPDWRARVLSSADAPVLVLDLRHHKDTQPKLRTFDLADALLYGGEGEGVYKNQIVPLGAFPHLQVAISHAMLDTLQTTHLGRPDNVVPPTFGTCKRIFCWMLANGFYKLEDVPRSAILTLVDRLETSTWSRVLAFRRVLARICIAAKRDPTLASSLAGKGSSNKGGINISKLSDITGLYISGKELPKSFRRRITELSGHRWDASVAPSSKDYRAGAALATTLNCLNLLSNRPPPIDCFPYIPFPSVLGELRTRETIAPQQTPNLSLEDARKIFANSIKWVYERAPLVLAMLNEMRSEFLSNDSGDLLPVTIDRAAKRRIETYISLAPTDTSWLNMDDFNLTRGNMSLYETVNMVFAAVACLIGINHGRRVNEIIGRELPYGLYYGCTQPIKGMLHEWRIDIYCEKGIQDYRVFPANAIIADCVDLMQKFSDVLRPLNTPVTSSERGTTEARLNKLFRVRILSLTGYRSPLADFDFRGTLDAFLTESGCEPKKFHWAHLPFRRMFAVLFTNRYDCPEIMALSQHMGHLALSSTIPYRRDEFERRRGESIPEMLGTSNPDSEGMLEALKLGRVEYLTQKVQELLSGIRHGGFFPRLVAKLAKSLSRSTDFQRADIERKATKISEILISHNYLPEPMPHVSCFAHNPRATIRLAKCFRDGRIHREDSSHEKCTECLHALKSQQQIANLETQVAEEVRNSTNGKLPMPLRQASNVLALKLDRLLVAEYKIANSNKELFEALTISWQREVLGDGK